MGLDQYLYAKKYTSESEVFNTKEQFNELKDALGDASKFLYKNFPSI